METIQDQLIQQFQNMDRAYEAYAKSKGLIYHSLMVLDEIYELGNGCTQKQISEDIIVPLLQREEQTMSAIGQTESQELIRLLNLYGKTYCEQIGSIEK